LVLQHLPSSSLVARSWLEVLGANNLPTSPRASLLFHSSNSSHLLALHRQQ